MIELLIVIAAILVASGFFSGIEAALVSLTEADVETIKSHKHIGAPFLWKVSAKLSRSVITIVIFNNVVNIVGSIAVGRIVMNVYGDAILAVVTTALTFGIIVFAEILPKAVGIHYREKVSLFGAPIIWALTVILLPLIILLEKMTNIFTRGQRKVGTEAQIRSLVTIGRRAGHIETDEGQIIHRAFILNDKHASDIMTPLKDVVGILEDMTIAEAHEKVVKNIYSRYPVFGVAIHDIEGLLMRDDILEALVQGKGEESVRSIMREMLVVPHDKPADELLVLFRDQSIHLAVVQHDGKTVGVVSLEDVLEELVGEIEDEVDKEEEGQATAS